MLSKHHDGNLWVDPLNLSREDYTVQEARVALDHNRIDGPQHEKL